MSSLVSLSRRSRIFSILRPPSPTLNIRRKALFQLVKETQTRGEIILEIGSGGRKLTENVITMDIECFENVELVGEAEYLPVKDSSIDFVIITAVLEHVKDPDSVVSEIYRVLRINGLVYVEMPFLQPFHADPNDFQRYTLEGIKHKFHNFHIIDSGACAGPFSSIAFFIRKFPTIFFLNEYLIKSLEFVIGWLTFWVKYFDLFLIKLSRLHIVSSGVFALFKKD